MSETPQTGTANGFLPFDPAELTHGIRVRPADFARMCGVSKQAVSQWIKTGKVMLYPDGTLDPVKSAKRVIDHTDPSRLRAKVFRVVTDDVTVLRRRVVELEAVVAEHQKRIAYLVNFIDELERAETIFVDLVKQSVGVLAAATHSELNALVQELQDRASLMSGGFDPDEPVEKITLPDMGGRGLDQL